MHTPDLCASCTTAVPVTARASSSAAPLTLLRVLYTLLGVEPDVYRACGCGPKQRRPIDNWIGSTAVVTSVALQESHILVHECSSRGRKRVAVLVHRRLLRHLPLKLDDSSPALLYLHHLPLYDIFLPSCTTAGVCAFVEATAKLALPYTRPVCPGLRDTSREMEQGGRGKRSSISVHVNVGVEHAVRSRSASAAAAYGGRVGLYVKVQRRGAVCYSSTYVRCISLLLSLLLLPRRSRGSWLGAGRTKSGMLGVVCVLNRSQSKCCPLRPGKKNHAPCTTWFTLYFEVIMNSL